ncbi:hypothetical protein HOG21_06105 [bacterium]|jgi:hypothetical protein|nr:hypothetical protein [bacterium]
MYRNSYGFIDTFNNIDDNIIRYYIDLLYYYIQIEEIGGQYGKQYNYDNLIKAIKLLYSQGIINPIIMTHLVVVISSESSNLSINDKKLSVTEIDNKRKQLFNEQLKLATELKLGYDENLYLKDINSATKYTGNIEITRVEIIHHYIKKMYDNLGNWENIRNIHFSFITHNYTIHSDGSITV